MTDYNVVLRCGNCSAVNRIPAARLKEHPKCGKCKRYLEYSTTPIDVTTSDFDKEVLQWPGSVLVEFWTPWCGYCRMMAPLVNAVAAKYAGVLKVAKVDLDNEPVLGARFSITATPAFYLFRNGIKLDEVAGAVPKEQLEEWISTRVFAK